MTETLAPLRLPVETDRGRATAAANEVAQYRRRIDLLLKAAGVEPPVEWVAVSGAFDVLLSHERGRAQVALGELSAALRAGASSDVPGLFDELAAASQHSGSALWAALEPWPQIVRPAGERAAALAYAAAADKFNTHASKWVELASVTDIMATAEKAMRRKSAEQQAWLQAADVSAELDATHGLVVEAAMSSDESPSRLPSSGLLSGADYQRVESALLCCTSAARPTADALRAWLNTDGRLSRWGNLHAQGLTIVARPLTQVYSEGAAA